MIKLFRNIRKKLLKEGKLANYLTYAIGEIILVVFGILIALQINNWNEIKKTRTLETKILKELYNNLVLDIKEIEHDITYMDSINKACSEIKTYLGTYDAPNENLFKTLVILRVTTHFDPNKSGYELLKSKGVEVISNDSLRNSISLLFERTYPYFRRYEEERIKFHQIHCEPVLLKYLHMNFNIASKYNGHFIILNEDYSTLKKDTSFLKLLSSIAFETSAVQNRGERTEAAIKTLIKMIATELEHR